MAIQDRYVAVDGDTTDAQAAYDAAVDLAHACSLTVALKYAVAGDRVRICKGNKDGSAGTYARTTTSDTPANAGSATSPIIFHGADASGNLITVSRTNGNGPLVTTNYPSITYTLGRLTAKAYTIWRALSISNTGYNGAAFITIANSSLTGCSITTSSTGAAAYAVHATSALVMNNDISVTSASGALAAVFANASTRVLYNRITNSLAGSVGILISATSASPCIRRNLIYATAGHAIVITLTTGVSEIAENTCVDITGSYDGIHFTTGSSGVHVVINNVLTDAGAYGINCEDAACPLYSSGNRLTRNLSGAKNGGTDWFTATSFGDVTTAQAGANTAAQRLAEYVSPGSANYDYRLKPASYAIGAGVMSVDIGACQSLVTIPTASDVWYGSGEYGYAGSLTTPTKRASSITNCSAANVKSDVTIDDVTGTLSSGGGGIIG
jgi:hypothetical protein